MCVNVCACECVCITCVNVCVCECMYVNVCVRECIMCVCVCVYYVSVCVHECIMYVNVCVSVLCVLGLRNWEKEREKDLGVTCPLLPKQWL